MAQEYRGHIIINEIKIIEFLLFLIILIRGLIQGHVARVNLNLNSLLLARQMTLFHQGVRMGEKLVP